VVIPIKALSPAVDCASFRRANVVFGALGFVTHGYRGDRDAMKIPDYIAIGVLIILLVWAVADQFPGGKL
jgi:hypothetical protein